MTNEQTSNQIQEVKPLVITRGESQIVWIMQIKEIADGHIHVQDTLSKQSEAIESAMKEIASDMWCSEEYLIEVFEKITTQIEWS